MCTQGLNIQVPTRCFFFALLCLGVGLLVSGQDVPRELLEESCGYYLHLRTPVPENHVVSLESFLDERVGIGSSTFPSILLVAFGHWQVCVSLWCLMKKRRFPRELSWPYSESSNSWPWSNRLVTQAQTLPPRK